MKKYIIASSVALFAFASIVSVVGAREIEYTFSKDLSIGASGPDVIALQDWLISSGYDIPALSSKSASYGYFGTQTREAVRKFQENEGLPNTGYFGRMSRGRLHDRSRPNTSPLNIISPNGGEVWPANSTHQIAWTLTGTTDVNTKVDIYLDQTNIYANCITAPCPMLALREPYVLDRNIPLSTIYNWIVATDINNIAIPVNNQYKVRVCIAGSTTNCDSSDSVLTIMPTIYPTN